MSKLILTKRNLKYKFPRLSSVYTNSRFLKEFNRILQMICHLEKFSRRDRISANGQKVVINSIRSYMPFQLVIEAMLALKLRSRGYDVTLLYDDGVMRHHDTLTFIEHKPFQSYYKFPRRASLALLRRLEGFSNLLRPYSKYCSAADLSRIKDLVERDVTEHEGVDLKPFMEASLVRFFLSAPDRELLESEPEYGRAYRMFLENCHVSLTVAREVFKRETPDILITSHGIYSTWGVFMKYMMNRSVRSVTFGANGYNVNSLDFGINSAACNKSDNGYLEHLVATGFPDNDQALEKVDRLMAERFAGTAADIARLGCDTSSKTSGVFERVQHLKKQGRRLFGLFPNVMWDNATTFKEWNRVFESPVQWLVETVRYLVASGDKALIIRVHPAEYSWMPVRKSIVDILKLHLGEDILSHENIVLIPPEQKLSSYSLFDDLSGGIVYNGTIGPELIYRGVPLILGAKAAYSDKGFTFDIGDRQTYFTCFDRTDEILRVQKEGYDKVRMFLYEYFFLHGVPVKFISTTTQFRPNWNGDPAEMWHDDNMEHIIATITGEREFFQDYARMQAPVSSI